MKVLWAILLLPFVASQGDIRDASCFFYEHPNFGYTCEVVDLNFSAGEELRITGMHLAGKSNANVGFVEIVNSTLEVVPQQFLIQFPILNRFYAQGASMSTLNRLHNCENLQHLFLSSNFLDTISADTFADCTNLRVLHLQNNVISTIERWAFRDLVNLQVLLLTNNELEVINADLFTPVPNLIDLGLSNNYLTTLNVRTFTPTPFLETLRLANNQFSILNVNIFQNLLQLSTLLLNGNQFDNFQANFFRPLVNLQHLNIDNNVVSLQCNGMVLKINKTRTIYKLHNVAEISFC